jgi:hypothetical protein
MDGDNSVMEIYFVNIIFREVIKILWDSLLKYIHVPKRKGKFAGRF